MPNLAVHGLFITAVVTAMSSAAHAVVVFQDNFEDVPGVSSYPDTSTDADPVAQVGTWIIAESQPSRVQVTTSYSPVEGTQALTTERTGDGASILFANFAQPAPPTPADLMTISFLYKDPTPDPQFGGTVDVFMLYGINDTDTNFDNQVFDLRIFKNWGDSDDVYVGFGANGSSADPPTGARYADVGDPSQVWNRVEMEIDFTAHQYRLTINGQGPVAGPSVVSFNGDAATANQMRQLVFYHLNSNLTRFAIDDVLITAVPEPVSTSMIVMGLSALTLRRRHQ
jgi:hypothetical protein